MRKKYIAYIVLGMVLIGTLATLSIGLIAAQGGDGVVEVGQNQYQTKQDGNGEVMYRFQARTRIRINSSQNVHLNMNVDAMNIGDKTFSLDIETDHEYELNMWCVRDQDQLGIQNGSTVRNQNRHQVRNNFAAQIQVNASVQARIGMEMTKGDADRLSWAYYDEPTEEWVEVASSYEDGMLVAYTDHFSIWTIVEAPSLIGLWIGIGVGIVAMGALAAILIYRKRVTA